jgi:hypothetical protein
VPKTVCGEKKMGIIPRGDGRLRQRQKQGVMLREERQQHENNTKTEVEIL